MFGLALEFSECSVSKTKVFGTEPSLNSRLNPNTSPDILSLDKRFLKLVGEADNSQFDVFCSITTVKPNSTMIKCFYELYKCKYSCV